MKGEDFITLAGFLATLRNNPVYEACCRSAVSRAYYGAYHVSRVFLEDIGLIVGEAHPELALDFRGGELEESVYIGSLLNELRKRRNVADYELSKSGTSDAKNCQYAVGMAHDIVNNLGVLRQKLKDDVGKLRLKAAIESSRSSRPVKGR